MPAYVDESGNLLRLGTILGQGGEGVVYEITSDPSVVAKIYHKPLDPAHTAKLSAMTRSATVEIASFAAWPRGLVNQSGKAVGVLMRRVDGGNRPIHELYTPKTRLRDFPSADCAFLIHVASNVARGFAVIHSAGHVIGDVNHGNILVSRNGLSAFIDCDSFQIAANGQIFPCGVGVSTFTPPELQSVSNLALVTRTQNHDAFGLAVLIFHLLFMGRHPFAGRFLGNGDMPIERAIKEFRFPFGKSAQQAQMCPPPNSINLSQVPPEVAQTFERAFSKESANGSSRPTSREWLAALESFKLQLARCAKNKSHLYFSRLPACPWCPIEDNGVILFLEVAAFSGPTLNLDQLWQRITSSAFQADLPPIPTIKNTQPATPSPQSRRSGLRRRATLGAGMFMVALAVVVVSTSHLDQGLAFFGVLGTILFAILLPRNLQARHAKLVAYASGLKQSFDASCSQYASECSANQITQQIRNLESIRRDLTALPEKRRRKLFELEQNKRQSQLLQFLDNCSLRKAAIQGIGTGRKQMLAAYGIDSAADLTPQKLFQVPGIGPKFANRLLAWRTMQENHFRFDPTKPTDKLLIAKIEQEFRSLSNAYENSLKKGVEDVVNARAALVTRRDQYQKQLRQSFSVYLQAQADAKAS